MKKIFTFVLALVATVAVSAQQEEGTWSIAPKAGINIASLTESNGGKSLVGFVGGAEATWQTSNRVALSAGLFYSQQGMKVEKSDIKEANNYLNIPILTSVYLCKGLALKAGIQPGFMLSAKAKNNDTSVDMKDGMKTFDFTIPVGISYEFRNIILDARYNIGLTKTVDIEDIIGSKNSVFMVTLGYKFCL